MLQFPNENLRDMEKASLKTNDQTSVERHDFMVLEKRVQALELLIQAAQKRNNKGK
jgi:hypothetical protein